MKWHPAGQTDSNDQHMKCWVRNRSSSMSCLVSGDGKGDEDSAEIINDHIGLSIITRVIILQKNLQQ
jgi:hypothetical protein